MPFDAYCTSIERALRRGDATEHTHRPAQKALLESVAPNVVATNEPRRIACGAPDFSVSRRDLTIGYVEAKDIGADLNEIERSEQLQRYRRSLGNLVLTDGLEFRWYVGGEFREDARLGRWVAGHLRPDAAGAQQLATLLDGFLEHAPVSIDTPRDLAQHLARLAHMVRDIVKEAFQQGHATADLRGLRDAFSTTLLPELADDEHLDEFADMYAQTLAYGLFAARCHHRGPGRTFQRLGAAGEIPKTNPLLRRLFESITGTALDDEPQVGFVNDLVQVLAHADMESVLRDFGARTRQEDPVVHFYETFLQQYDPTVREMRGVYYTPEPVVGYIVRSVDWLLKEKFGLSEGLADRSTVTVTRTETDSAGRVVEHQDEHPQVLILDPACGTGTFLYHVVDHIREAFRERNDAGMWPGFVRDHLLPRLFGFELLMAPYAVAHLKLGMQLAGQDLPAAEQERWAYDFASDERLRIYLTNTLEEAEREVQMQFGVQRALAEEANAASEVKRDLPIMVVLGNPPYSNFGRQNRNDFVLGLLDDYKRGLHERKINLNDDFIKFIRWAQWRIERTGRGVLGFITNHVYLDGITHRRMRESLMETFDEIYVLDLHGNARKRELTPDGLPDANVFDIQQGVAICLMVKLGGNR